MEGERGESEKSGVEVSCNRGISCSVPRYCVIAQFVLGSFPAQILSDFFLTPRTALDELLLQCYLSVVCSSNSNATSHNVKGARRGCYLSIQSPSIALPDCPFQLVQQTWI